MWSRISATTSLALVGIMSVQAQSVSNGAVVVTVPSDMLTCEPASVQWVWTGATSDADSRVLNMAVEQVGGSNDRRSLSEPSPVRFIRKRSESRGLSHVRRAPINIAGGSNIPLTAGSWTWNSVGVPIGTYKMSLLLEPDSVVFFSDPFTVSQGPDTSCLGTLGASTTSSATSQVLPAISTSVPATTLNSSETTTIANNTPSTIAPSTSSSSPTNASIATRPPTQTNIQSNIGNQTSHHHISGGGIAAAVILPLLVLGVLIYLCCMRRNADEDTSHSSSTKRKLATFFNNSSSNQNRPIGTPMDPIHSGGYKNESKGVNNEKVLSPSSEHWVDFQPNTPEHDAHLVTSELVDAMVRESMDQGNQRSLYRLGQNSELRRSQTATKDGSRILSDASSLPTHLQDANLVSRPKHSSTGQDRNGRDFKGAGASEGESNPTMLERGNSKIRRKPAPTYSTYSTAGLTKKSVAEESSNVPLPEPQLDIVEEQGPFSDSHEIVKGGVLNDGNQQDEEVIGDSPTLPQEGTPVNSMRSFPVSVYSTNIDSPSQRVLLGAQRESLSEEERNRLYKLSIQMPQDERGFRVSF